MTMEILGTKVSSVFHHRDFSAIGVSYTSEHVRTLVISPDNPIVIQGVEYHGTIGIYYYVEKDGSIEIFEKYLDLDSFTRSTGKPVKNRVNLRKNGSTDGVESSTITSHAYDLIRNGGDVDRIAQDGIRYVKSWITRQENAAKREAREYLATAVATAPDTIREQVKALAGL